MPCRIVRNDITKMNIPSELGYKKKYRIKHINAFDMEEDNIPYIQYAEINTLFTEGQPLDDWMKPMLLNKEEYIQFIKSEDFERAMESAWVSDGEYYYYPVSTYTENWINKQPFNYILRSL